MTQQRHIADVSSTPWVTELAHVAKQMNPSAESRMRTMISCDTRSGKQAIFVPPDMSLLQPRTLRYLQVFARQHDLQLVEDRRRVNVTPLRDLRNAPTSSVCNALGQLLKQLGLPGAKRSTSWPHRLGPDSQHIEISKLIRMAAFAAPQAKRAVVEPNKELNDILNSTCDEINVYGCKLISEQISTVLGIFDSKNFRALGYSTGKQYVVHVCLAGGEITNPRLWADFHTLTRTDFQLQLLEAQNPKHDVGLFYATFYLDLSEAPSPWWLSLWGDTKRNPVNPAEPVTLRRTG